MKTVRFKWSTNLKKKKIMEMKSSFNRLISILDIADGKKMSDFEDGLLKISIFTLLQMQK